MTIKTRRETKFDHVILFQYDEPFGDELWCRLPRVKATPIRLPWMLPYSAAFETNKKFKPLKVFLFSSKRKYAQDRCEISIKRHEDGYQVATLYKNGKQQFVWAPCKAVINRMPRTFYVGFAKIEQHFQLHDFDPCNSDTRKEDH